MIAQEPKARKVPPVSTPYRRIVTDIPVPESIPVLKRLLDHEPRSMGGQPPVVWDRAEGIQVYDRWGNMWLDWSSGVLVTNAGHCHPKIRQAILDQVNHGLIHNYCFPSEVRAAAVEALARVAPQGLEKVFLLTTGAEACECAIKLARTWGRHIGGDKKIGIVTFQNAFHGRTLGAQMAGGIPGPEAMDRQSRQATWCRCRFPTASAVRTPASRCSSRRWPSRAWRPTAWPA